MALNTTISITLKAADDGGASGAPTTKDSVHLIQTLVNLANGVGVGQADLAVGIDDTVASGSTDDHDLRGGVVDAFGNVVDMAQLVAVGLINENTADGDDLELGPSVSNGALTFWGAPAHRVVCPAGGMVLLFDPNGRGMAAGSLDSIAIDQVGNAVPVNYQLVLIGRSV